MIKRGLATSSGQILSIAADISSKPLAFLLSNFFIIAMIWEWEKVMSERELLVRGVKTGREDSMSKGRHCNAKYLLNIEDFSLKSEMYLPSSNMGGMLVIFFLLERRLYADQNVF